MLLESAQTQFDVTIWWLIIILHSIDGLYHGWATYGYSVCCYDHGEYIIIFFFKFAKNLLILLSDPV